MFGSSWTPDGKCGVLSKRFGVPKCCLAGAFLFCLLIPAYGGFVRMFYILYFTANIGYTFISYAIPAIIFQNTPSRKIGAFQTWRMVVTGLGSAAATALVGLFLDVFPAWAIIGTGAAGYLFCAAAYLYRYGRLDMVPYLYVPDM